MDYFRSRSFRFLSPCALRLLWPPRAALFRFYLSRAQRQANRELQATNATQINYPTGPGWAPENFGPLELSATAVLQEKVLTGLSLQNNFPPTPTAWAGTGWEAYLGISHPARYRRPPDPFRTPPRPGEPAPDPAEFEFREFPYPEIAEANSWSWHPTVPFQGSWDFPDLDGEYWSPETGPGRGIAANPEQIFEIETPSEAFTPTQWEALAAHLEGHTGGELRVAVWEGFSGFSHNSPGSCMLAYSFIWADQPRLSAAEMRQAAADYATTQAKTFNQQLLPAAFRNSPKWELPDRSYVLFAVHGCRPLTDLAHYLADSPYVPRTVQYIWPADSSWVVTSDIYTPFTVVGGPRALVEALHADPRLRTFKLDANQPLYERIETA